MKMRNLFEGWHDFLKEVEDERLKGGVADGLDDEEVADELSTRHKVPRKKVHQQLDKGEKVEGEHTHDDQSAREIARDHQVEYSRESGKWNYYDDLMRMEKGAHEEELEEDATGKRAWGDKKKKHNGWPMGFDLTFEFGGEGGGLDEDIGRLERQTELNPQDLTALDKYERELIRANMFSGYAKDLVSSHFPKTDDVSIKDDEVKILIPGNGFRVILYADKFEDDEGGYDWVFSVRKEEEAMPDKFIMVGNEKQYTAKTFKSGLEKLTQK